MVENGKPSDGGGEPDLRTIDDAWPDLIKSAWVVGLKPSEFAELTPIEWEAIAQAHGIKQERLDYRAALICSVIANVNRNPKKRPQPYKPKDFMPKANKAQTPEEQLAVVKALNAALGGKVV